MGIWKDQAPQNQRIALQDAFRLVVLQNVTAMHASRRTLWLLGLLASTALACEAGTASRNSAPAPKPPAKVQPPPRGDVLTARATTPTTGQAPSDEPSNAHPFEACTTPKFATEKVEQACRDGGRAAAEKLMKSMVKRAEAAGVKLKCLGCHKDRRTFELEPDAAEHLKKWL